MLSLRCGTTSTTVPLPLSSLPGRGIPASLDQLRALRCAVGVAREGSASAAGDHLHASPSAVTRAVAGLEAWCGLPLFERGARGMVPTPAGAHLAARAGRLLDQLRLGALDAQSLAIEQRGRTDPARFAAAVAPGALRAFACIASSGSESGAARLLGLSQPAVHSALAELQRLAGATLLQKTPRGSRLTHAGEAMLRRVLLAFSEARALESELAVWQGTLRGRVVVGALPLSVSLVLPAALELLMRDHPEVEVTVVDGTYESLVQQLLRADVDLIVGALRDPPPSTEVQQEVLFRDDLAVVAREGHPALRPSRRGLASLLELDWVVPLAGTPAHAALERAFASEGLPAPQGHLRAGSPALTRALALQTGRLAIASRGEALLAGTPGLRVVPVPLPATTREIGIVWRAMGEPSPDLLALQDALRGAAAALARKPS